ncbi:MAG: bifunctional pyr operon transcriptional regulator/uracil phosphoribosyltransferase, partial [Actinobacteria bacterium]|nr:bifunctional pyr operon transcriptional regulator/uracil phosphoribosyltransferase [Actinomycetota bacterium]NIU18800.1 bifunctional pyr operon transcriptional regulator/uracil phosphoribosyltransferase [Actinomycetota bacterium]NIV55287.1 bifunctional pyr operon transcriptional regulator/uracil phosphoribosyltransferase [Actinomycetota bacterium]NIV86665.1 bifunctional pyr operon transcriptional regulator/uracil phosphoribosyltransferase [Actinomycetota bacterium]NIW30016.1 bifunctional pyr
TDVGGKPCLVGIRTRGVPLAQRLQKKIGEIQGEEPALGLLDINLYRDDVSQISDHP